MNQVVLEIKVNWMKIVIDVNKVVPLNMIKLKVKNEIQQ